MAIGSGADMGRFRSGDAETEQVWRQGHRGPRTRSAWSRRPNHHGTTVENYRPFSNMRWMGLGLPGVKTANLDYTHKVVGMKHVKIEA